MDKPINSDKSINKKNRPSDQIQNINSKQNNWQLLSHSQKWHPPTDVFETNGNIIVRVEIAGMQENDIDITYNNNVLNVSGNRTDSFDNIKAFHQMEVNFGEFLSAIEINTPILLDKAEANYQNGILIIKLPIALPKSITINK
jgi:HSP20 family protein